MPARTKPAMLGALFIPIHRLRVLLLLSLLVSVGKADSTANGVYGQGGSFTSNAVNNGGLSALSLSLPSSTTLDAAENLYVSDLSNNRVLFYLKGSTTPSRVYGQLNSFTTNTAALGSPTADTLVNPSDVAIDSAGNVYIADGGDNRVLVYAGTSTTATTVYGQGNVMNTNTANKGGISADSLFKPMAVAVDATRNLYVADGNNNRVLFYPVGSTTATRVYGQGGSFSTAVSTPVTSTSLFFPSGLVLDAAGNLYVADSRNNRILFFPAGTTTATRVYGQVSLTSNDGTNPGGVSANTLVLPRAVTLDAAGNLYAADSGNNRALFYPAGTTTATKVYGQLDSLTSNTANNGGVSARSSSGTSDVAIDASGKLYVADTLNNRVLTYDSATTGTTSTSSSTGTPAPGVTCFHLSTIITYKGKNYSYQQLLDGAEKECRVPHTTRCHGLKFELVDRRPDEVESAIAKRIILRLTGDHLVSTSRGMIQAQYLKTFDRVYGDLLSKTTAYTIVSITREKDEEYFGLNCLKNIVLANGVRTSTFGIYHLLPSLWMEVIGYVAGIDRASRWGDSIAGCSRAWGLI